MKHHEIDEEIKKCARQCNDLGWDIYELLVKQFPNRNHQDLNMILNTICASLVIHIKNNVEEDDRKTIIQFIYNCLNENI